MTSEVTLVGRVDVDVDDLDKFGGFAAVVPAQPVEAVYVQRGRQRQRAVIVHAFTASGVPLVLGRRGLVSAASGAGPEETFDHVRPYNGRFPAEAVGPFTPAPPGLTAEFDEAEPQPILFFDRYGRPVLVDNEPRGRELYPAGEDEALVRITGQPAWGSNGTASPGEAG